MYILFLNDLQLVAFQKFSLMIRENDASITILYSMVMFEYYYDLPSELLGEISSRLTKLSLCMLTFVDSNHYKRLSSTLVDTKSIMKECASDGEYRLLRGVEEYFDHPILISPLKLLKLAVESNMYDFIYDYIKMGDVKYIFETVAHGSIVRLLRSCCKYAEVKLVLFLLDTISTYYKPPSNCRFAFMFVMRHACIFGRRDLIEYLLSPACLVHSWHVSIGVIENSYIFLQAFSSMSPEIIELVRTCLNLPTNYNLIADYGYVNHIDISAPEYSDEYAALSARHGVRIGVSDDTISYCIKNYEKVGQSLAGWDLYSLPEWRLDFSLLIDEESCKFFDNYIRKGGAHRLDQISWEISKFGADYMIKNGFLTSGTGIDIMVRNKISAKTLQILVDSGVSVWFEEDHDDPMKFMNIQPPTEDRVLHFKRKWDEYGYELFRLQHATIDSFIANGLISKDDAINILKDGLNKSNIWQLCGRIRLLLRYGVKSSDYPYIISQVLAQHTYSAYAKYLRTKCLSWITHLYPLTESEIVAIMNEESLPL